MRADQTLASETLVPLRPESGIPDRLTPDECVFPCVALDRKRVQCRKVLLDDANAIDGEAGRGRRIG